MADLRAQRAKWEEIASLARAQGRNDLAAEAEEELARLPAPPPSGQTTQRELTPAQQAKIDRTKAKFQPAPAPTFLEGLGTALNPVGLAKNIGEDFHGNLDAFNENFLFGAYPMLTDALGLDSPGQRQERIARTAGQGLAGGITGGTASGFAGPEALLAKGLMSVPTVVRGGTEVAKRMLPQNLGNVGMMGLLESKVPALANDAARLATAPAVGALTSGTVEGARAAYQGASPEDIGASFVEGLPMGALLGLGFQIPGTARAGADALRARSRDLQVLEQRRASPSPLPLRPVKNAPSKQLHEQPTSEGRGALGERAATRMQDEVARLDRRLTQRTGAELEDAMGRQGKRQISTESLIAKIDEQLADPGLVLNPKAKAGLERAKKVLAGELEPTTEIYPANVKYNERGKVPVEVPELDPDYSASGVNVPYDPFPVPGREPIPGRPIYRGGERIIPPPGPEYRTPDRPLNRHIQTIPEEYTVSAGGEDAIRIGTGDVRGRVGEAPNRVRSASDLNKIRDALDEAAGAYALEQGIDKKNAPFFSIAQEIRHGLIKKHAPGIALANRRAHTARNKLEVTRERMKDTESPDSERLGMQIASLGEEGSKIAGARRERFRELTEQWPEPERPRSRSFRDVPETDVLEPPPPAQKPAYLTREEVAQILGDPRALLAEEKMAFKNIPRIGSGGSDSLNLLEPLLGRYAYPLARGVGNLLPSWGLQYLPGFLPEMRALKEKR